MGQVPPPFQPGVAPKRKSNTGLIVAIIAACILIPCGLCGLGLFYVYSNGKQVIGCTVNFQLVQESIHDYATDHNGKLPDAAKWQDEIKPYFEKRVQSKEAGPFVPMDPNGMWGCTEEKPPTGMAFNSDLSAKKLSSIDDPTATVLIFETPTPSMNQNAPYKYAPGERNFFGRKRPWLLAHVTGQVNMGNTNFNSSLNNGSTG